MFRPDPIWILPNQSQHQHEQQQRVSNQAQLCDKQQHDEKEQQHDEKVQQQTEKIPLMKHSKSLSYASQSLFSKNQQQWRPALVMDASSCSISSDNFSFCTSILDNCLHCGGSVQECIGKKVVEKGTLDRFLSTWNCPTPCQVSKMACLTVISLFSLCSPQSACL